MSTETPPPATGSEGPVSSPGATVIPFPGTPPPIHPPLPLGAGSYVTLTGISGAVAAFIIGWIQAGELTPAVVALGVAAVATTLTWFAGRSMQAKAAIEKVGDALAAVGIQVSATPVVVPEEEKAA